LRAHVRKCESNAGVTGVLSIAASLERFSATPADLDADPYLLNTANGTLDLRTLELRAHEPADRITKITTAAYIADSPAATWATFLTEVLPDAEVREFVQRLVGVGLLGRVVEHVLAIFTGTGANGKGTFDKALRHALGDYASTVEPDLFLHIHSQAVHLSTVELKLMSPPVAPCGGGCCSALFARGTSRRSRLAIVGLGVCGVSLAATRALAAMPARVRVGQLFAVGVPAGGLGAAGAVITANGPGGVFLSGRSTAGAGVITAITAEVQRAGRAASRGVALFVATDQEGSQVQVLSGPGFSTIPSAAVQGGWSPSQLQNAATGWGQQLRAAGINVDLAPVSDVLSPALGTANAPIGRYDRAYGTDPQTVAQQCGSCVRRGGTLEFRDD